MRQQRLREQREAYERATTKWLREFSPVGPCITLGKVLRITPKGVTYIDSHGRAKRRGGRAWKEDGSGLLHIQPCRSCADHTNSQYPHGYMD